jgi:tetratricopeptide (TPR) repeat protein
MFKKGLLPPFSTMRVLALSAVISGFNFVVLNESLAEELPISKDQSQALLNKTVALESEIQRRQLEPAVQPAESPGYQSGYEDGYNKAIIDLLKSKLLNDPSLSPKPKGAGLYAMDKANSTVNLQQVEQYPSQRMAPMSDVVISPAPLTPITAASPAPLVPMATVPLATVPLATLTSGVTSSGSSVAAPADSITTQATTATTGTPAEGIVKPQVTVQPQPHIMAQQWLQKSNDYVADKKWQQAINAATHAVALDSSLLDAYIVRSWANAENGQHQQALADIATAIRLDPNNALAYNNRAYIQELLNNIDKAQQDYQQACTLGYQPACETLRKLNQMLEQQRLTNIKELTNKSYQQFQQKDWRGVVKTTTELLVVDPENTDALANRAGAYTELGLYSKALEDCNAALILDPNMAIAYNNKGYVLELQGELKKAAMEYETACVLGVQQSCSDHKRLSQKVSARH